MSFKTRFPNKSKAKAALSQDNDEDDDIRSFQRSFSASHGAGTSSLFSSKLTMTTDGSSQNQSSSSNYQKDVSAGFTSVGRPLMMLKEDDEDDTFKPNSLPSSSYSGNTGGAMASQMTRGRISITSEDTIDDASFISLQSAGELEVLEFIKWRLNHLSNSMSNIIIRISQSVLNLTKASISIGDLIQFTRNTISQHRSLQLLSPHLITTTNSIGLRKVIKYMLHLLDNILIGEVYDKSRAIILKNFYDLLDTLKLIEKPVTGEMTNFATFLAPKIFPIGSNGISQDSESPNLKIVNSIMNSIIQKNNLFDDQEGSFLAPILRGFQSPNLSVISFLFGFPELNRVHYDVIKFFSRQEEEIHFFSQKNSIQLANGTGLKAPFRTIESNYIPMSMSISSNRSMSTSGTFGGYIYPKVPRGNTKLEKYRGKIFGMTCSHVVLTEGDINDQGEINSGNADVSIPSPVLINMYRNAFVKELEKFKVSNSPEFQAFNRMIKKIDEVYPQREVSINGQNVRRNLPKEQFGDVIWGERLVSDNKLSDLAIIKVNHGVDDKMKLVNYLGDDLNISDPTIILSNLNVKNVIPLSSKSFTVPKSNLPVFKLGSTTSYTNGRLNGMKLIYWSDGSLRSNEFVINGGDDAPFASGGDSGSWILSKMSDVNKGSNFDNMDSPTTATGVISNFIESFLPNLTKKEEQPQHSGEPNTGLGVLGMLHSYDGEFKQFGLFTPMDSILLRLKEITGIEWGVIGCDEFINNDIEDEMVSLTSD